MSSITLLNKLMPFCLGYSILFFLWSVNFNRVGCLYDYSIIIHGSYLVENGFKPHVDFHSPLPSLTIYLARLCEILFGVKFSSLGIGNLLFATFFFGVIYINLLPRFGAALASWASLAFIAAGPLQHSIIWYNSLGVGFIGILITLTIQFVELSQIGLRFHFLCFLILTTLALIKTNFLVIGIVLYSIALLTHATLFKKWMGIINGLIVVILSVGGFFLIESMINGAGFSQVYFDIFQIPEGRFADVLSNLRNPGSYLFGKIHNFYPRNISNGMLFIYSLFFILILRFAVKKSDCLLQEVLIAFCGFGFLACGLLNMVSNTEIQVLTLSFLLISAFFLVNLIFSFPKTELLPQSIKVILCALSAYTLLVGSFSIINHSRILYERDTQFIAASNYWGYGYFEGTRMTSITWNAIDKIQKKMSECLKVPNTKVFFGSSLEFFYRLTGQKPPVGLPLWWHTGVTWNAKMAPQIKSILVEQNYSIKFSHQNWISNEPIGWYSAESFYKNEFPPYILEIKK